MRRECLYYLIQLVELNPLVLRAAASNGADVQHPITEFDERPPAEERKYCQDQKQVHKTHMNEMVTVGDLFLGSLSLAM